MGMVELDASEIKFDPSSVQTEAAEEIEVGTGMEELAASNRGVSTEAPALLQAGPIVQKPHRLSCSLRERDAEMGMLDLRNSEEDMAEAIMKSTAAMEPMPQMESGEIFRSSSYSEVLGKAHGKPASVFAVAPKHAARASANRW